MNQFQILTKKYYPYLSSFFISTPPLLWLYINNWNETRISSFGIGMAIIIATCFLITTASYIATRSVQKSAIITSFLAFFIFSFGKIVELFYKHPTIINLLHFRAEKGVIIFALIIATALSIATRKKYINHHILAQYFFILGTLLMIPPIITLIQMETKRVSPIALPTLNIKEDAKISTNSPDIYYIIIERYASFDTLKKRYKFDSGLKKVLEKEDFYIASLSKPNYPHTSLSLASSLNLDYLDSLGKKSQTIKGDETHLHALIENNVLFSYLKKNNYRIYHIGDNWQGTETNRNTSLSYNYYAPFGAFTRQFLEMTLFDYLYKKYIYTTKTKIEWFKIQKKESEDFKINKLKEITASKEKKLVFAHILITHEPYILSKNGASLTDKEIVSRPHEKRYIDSVTYGNNVLAQMVQTIKHNKRPYVLIIQADEGPYTKELRALVDRGNFAWTKASHDAVKTHMSILNAYYFPNKSDYKFLYPSISPVNSFRVVLNRYFKQNLPTLKDRNYLNESTVNLYLFKDITKLLK